MARHGLLAIDGGPPVRSAPLPYARHDITEADIAAVSEALRSDWLTTGPRVAAFEDAVRDATGAAEAVAVGSGTAALHAAYHAVGLGPGDEVIVPAVTFVATANAARYVGATPVFADVDAGTLLLDPASVRSKIGPHTRAIVGVDFTGQPADYTALRALADGCGAVLIADACHALGGRDEGGRVVGTLADLSTFSFHPAKHITTLEGGAVVGADRAQAARMRTFRNHGISSDLREREARGTWRYELVELGYNMRISDVQCALGISQLTRLAAMVARRRTIAQRYDAALANIDGIAPLATRPGVQHAYHLYVVRTDQAQLSRSRDDVMRALRAEGIGVTLHYPAVHLQPYYRGSLGTAVGDCPEAEKAVEEIFTLPLFPLMTDADVDDVIGAVAKVLSAFRR